MPRPRFLKLPEEKRQSILLYARDEFVAHGYQRASLNRFLQAAGLSKGAFYYYFDDRDDLYALVVQQELTIGGIPTQLRDASNPKEFWSAVQEWMDGLYDSLLSSEAAMKLIRDLAGLMGSQTTPPVLVSMLETTNAIILEIVSIGQGLGAVRTDLPQELLVALVMKLGEAIDMWTAEHLEELAASPDKVRGLAMPLFQRLLVPSG